MPTGKKAFPLPHETAEKIAPRLGLTMSDAEARLQEMGQKGLILPVFQKGVPTMYQALPFVVGIYEVPDGQADG